MKIDANDPKWTAYALDEITDKRERAEIESVIRQSPEIAALVEEIRETAGWLKGELASEPVEALTPAQRKRIEMKAAKTSSGGFLFGLFGWKPAWGYAIAAAAVIVVALIAVRTFRQTEISRPEPILTADVHEKSLPETTDDSNHPIGTEPQSISQTHAETSAGAANNAARKNVAVPGGFIADTTISKEIPPPANRVLVAEAIKTAPSTNTESMILDAGASTGTVTQEKQVAQLPTVTNDVLDLINVMGGVVKADNPLGGGTDQTFAGGLAQNNASRDEISVNEIRYNSGIASKQQPTIISQGFVEPTIVPKVIPPPLAKSATTGSFTAGGRGGRTPAESVIQEDIVTQPNEVSYNAATMSPSRMNTEMVDEFKMILSPVDAEMGRGAGQVKAKTKNKSGNEKMAQQPTPPPVRKFNTEDYEPIRDNPFMDVTQNPLSTFSIDVDTASYSNMRRFLENGSLPPKDSIRIEELVNYFDYDYKAPKDGKPFAANVEMTDAPWNPKHRLLRIGLKGREIDEGKRPESNLVFLIDVSGSMDTPNRLPLVKDSMKMLVDKLTESDRVAIVTYAGDTRLLLPSTRGDQKATLRGVIDGLRAGGSTNGASGIQLAYQTAQENFIKGGVNRVILATDGDFNVGITNRGDLTRLIEEKAKSGIFLSALGFGMGNYKDTTLELLADKGRGNYAYIDTASEARKVLVEQINSTLVAIAKDVKIQVEFNPRLVKSYRLLGYENRVMAKEDFNNDAKMAGVIGAGHVVTAFYELELAGTSAEDNATKGVDPLRYQKPPQTSAAADSREIATVKIRSKEPEKDVSALTEFVIKDSVGRFTAASGDFKFAAAVAAFGMMLRDSPHKGNADFERVLEWAKAGKGEDRSGYREEFIRMVHRAASFPRR